MHSLNENSIVKKVFNALKVDDLNNNKYRNKNWVTQVHTVLHEYKYGYVWRFEEIDNTCLKSIKRRMLDNYYQNWYS